MPGKIPNYTQRSYSYSKVSFSQFLLIVIIMRERETDSSLPHYMSLDSLLQSDVELQWENSFNHLKKAWKHDFFPI